MGNGEEARAHPRLQERWAPAAFFWEANFVAWGVLSQEAFEVVFFFGVKTDLSATRQCAELRTEQRFPETRCVSARINHRPCQILVGDEMPGSSLLPQREAEWQRHLQRQKIEKTFLGNQFLVVQSGQYQDTNPFALESN